MLLHCFVALLAWSSVSAAKYCTPSKFEMYVAGNFVLKTGFGSIACQASYDYKKGMTNSNCLLTLPSHKTYVRTIVDLKAKKAYIINEKSGICIHLQRPMVPGQCFEGGKVVFNSYLGNSTLPFTTILKLIRGHHVYVSVTPGRNGTFIPVSTTIVHHGGNTQSYIGCFGYTDGIKDPSVFTIPAICHKTAQHEQTDEFQQMMKAWAEIEEFNRIEISFLQ